MSAGAPAIRLATAADAAALSAFATRAFLEAYAPVNDPADVELHVAQTYGPERQAAELATAGVSCLVAVEDGAITGYAMLAVGSRHPDIAAAEPAEIRRFYVDGTRHGRGVAAALMAAAADAARAAGCRTLWLTTWEHSLRARAFYRKCGFDDVGHTSFRLGASTQVDRLLVRRIA